MMKNKLVQKLIMFLVVPVASLYLLLSAVLYTAQSDLMYFPPSESLKECTFLKGGFKREENRFLYKLSPTAKWNLFYTHGNAESACTSLRYFQFLKNPQRYNVFALEYPGYSGNEGDISEENIYLRLEESVEDIQKKFGKLPNIFYGRSLGVAPAIHLAHKYSCDKLVLLSPYSSIAEVAQDHYPAFPIGLILKEKFDVSEIIPQITCATGIFHGQLDKIIPFKFGEKASFLFKNSKMKSYPKMGHNHTEEEIHKISQDVGEFLIQ